MHFRNRIICLAGAMVIAIGVRAQAPAAPPAAPERPKFDFSTVDKDDNGKLSRDEARAIAELEGSFDTLDSNRDQTVSPTEFAHWNQAGKANPAPRDPATAPRGSAGAQHVPDND